MYNAFNKYDAQRKTALVKTLMKAKEQAETASLYLTARDEVEQIVAVSQVLGWIEDAIQLLGVEEGDELAG
ncbi:hypothetical protein ACFFSY_13700 [Paenibacillus aurantiacus]|uniref:Uncharacterized protein n=1 Tax=Paenibacillus aurantiacus TaxID=1936118 RepID=A0ABV5KS83_9BACL